MNPLSFSKCATSVLLTLLVLVGGGTTTTRVWAQVGAPREAAVWHIATHGSDSTGDGSAAQPFATIQHGIDTASQGDTVLVQPGVYRENINFNGKNITVGSLFIITGDEDTILQTVIDGNRNGRVVTLVNGEAATAKLSGFTITNGYAHGTSEPETYGGGIYTRFSDPTLTHLRVTGNEAVELGGGLHFRDSSPTVRDIVVTNNRAENGGGIRYTGSSVNLENAVVTDNSATSGGSGLFFYHADGAIKNALIADNFGGGKGGGLGFDGCSPTFTNVTIVGNRTTGHGGGLNVSYYSRPTLVNSIVWGNIPEQIYFDTQWPGEAVTIEYSDIQGGQAGIVTNGQGPVHWGEGNLVTSPRFVHAGLGNYRLADDSPAVSAGKAEGAPATDLDGNPRPSPAGSQPDLGAYENPHARATSLSSIYLPLVIRALPPVAQLPFWADRYRLGPGECTTLHWSIEMPVKNPIQAIFLDGVAVAAYAMTQVCPVTTTTYVLSLLRANGATMEHTVTIVVAQAPAPQAGRPLAKIPIAKREDLYNTPPEMYLDTAKTYLATFDTHKGRIVIELNSELAPITVNNFVLLANLGYYDGMPVAFADAAAYLVTGSPASQPSSDVGYALPLEPTANARQVVTGTVSMYPVSGPTGEIVASGSQFFISFKAMPDNTTPLNIFGEVIEGMDVALNLVFGDIIEMITITERSGPSTSAPPLGEETGT